MTISYKAERDNPDRKKNIKKCLPSETAGKAGAGVQVRDSGICDLEPLPVSRLWNTMILIGTWVHLEGRFQNGGVEGPACCSAAQLIELDGAACGAQVSCIAFRVEVENEAGEVIGLLSPATAAPARF